MPTQFLKQHMGTWTKFLKVWKVLPLQILSTLQALPEEYLELLVPRITSLAPPEYLELLV